MVYAELLLKFLARLLHPVLVTMNHPEIVQRHRYVGRIGVRVLARQFTVDLQRLVIGLARLLHPALVTMKTPQVGQRRRDWELVTALSRQTDAAVVRLYSRGIAVQILAEVTQSEICLETVR